jgi:hypothetical protein
MQSMFLEELTLRYSKEDWLKIYDSVVSKEFVFFIVLVNCIYTSYAILFKK